MGASYDLVYVNDIPSAAPWKTLMHVYSTAFILPGSCTEVTQEPVLLGSKRKLHKNNTILVSCTGNKLACHTHVKYVGAKLDQSGDDIAENVITKLNAFLRYL